MTIKLQENLNLKFLCSDKEKGKVALGSVRQRMQHMTTSSQWNPKASYMLINIHE